MNKDLMRRMGFGQEVDDVERGVCPFCKKPISGARTEEFRDELSREEYKISGLCQECQDELFREISDD